MKKRSEKNFKVVHTLHFLDSISLFTNKMQYLSKNTIVRLLPVHILALVCHIQGLKMAQNC